MVHDPGRRLELVNFQQLNLDDKFLLCVSRDRRNPTHGGAQMYLGHWVIPEISIKHPPAQDRKMSMLRFCASGWLVDPSPENRPQNSNICHVLLEIKHLWAECWVLHPQLVNVQHDASDKSRCHLGGGVCGLLRGGLSKWSTWLGIPI